jgi:transposase
MRGLGTTSAGKLPVRSGAGRRPPHLGRDRLRRAAAEVGGSLGWLRRWRHLTKDYVALPEVSKAMVTLAMIRLMLHRLVHPNRGRLPAP